MAEIDRLSAQDATFLQVEAPSQPMHVGGLALFEGAPFRDGQGGFRLDDVRAAVEGRLHLVPRFRRKLRYPPLEGGHPVWVDDPEFDVANHVRHERLPQPGGWPELRHLVERLEAVMLDRDRPLWELWFVDGLEGDRVALVQKTHHALIDGISGIDVATVLLDFEREPPPIEAPAWEPEPAPADAVLFLEGISDLVAGPTSLLQSLANAVAHPEQTAEALLETAVEGGRALLANAAPPRATPWNVPVGPGRRYEVARVPLDRVRAIKAAVGASVNDVVLALCAGALRSYLLARDEEVDGTTLRTFVPVSVRREDERGAFGNRVSGLLADLPIGERDPAQRLQRVVEQMEALKGGGQAQAAGRILAVADMAPPAAVGFAARLIARQRTVNLGVTNIPGPSVPLYCMGAEMLEVFPYVGVFELVGLVVALISYHGQLGFGVTGDATTMADLDVLARAIEDESELLESAVTG